MVRTDRHNHRPVAGDSQTAEAVKVLARAHQSMVLSRRRQASMLRSVLREFYRPPRLPLMTWPARTPSIRGVPGGACAGSRSGADPGDQRAAEIAAALRSPQLQAPPSVSAAMGASVAAPVAVIATMNEQIAALARELEGGFRAAPGRRGGPFPARTGDHPRRPGARRVRRCAEPVCHRQVSQELRRNITDHPRLWHQAGRARPPRPQPAPRRRDLPVGLRLSQRLLGSPRLLRHPHDRRRHPPPCEPSATASPASCTAASPTTPPTTRPPPGPTASKTSA